MNPHMLDIALPGNPNLKLQEVAPDRDDHLITHEKNTSFEMVAEDGQVVGYVKTWHESDGYSGYVQFDSEGNVLDWKVLRDRQ